MIETHKHVQTYMYMCTCMCMCVRACAGVRVRACGRALGGEGRMCGHAGMHALKGKGKGMRD